jgi:hypothetical protein
MPLLATAEYSSAPPAYDTWKVGAESARLVPLHANASRTTHSLTTHSLTTLHQSLGGHASTRGPSLVTPALNMAGLFYQGWDAVNDA